MSNTHDLSLNEEKDIALGDVHLPAVEKATIVHVEDAIAAEHAEKNMTFWTAIKTYKASVFWSMAISATLIMEGYDTSLLGNAMAVPAFRQHYGHYLDAKNGYQLNPAWQSAVQNAPTIGAVIGILFAGWAQDRFGYRRTLQVCLVWLAAAIFIVFFAPNIYVLFVGELMCGLPWGAFSSSAVAYASDITPIALRGYLTIFVSMCWIIGQFIAGGLLVGIVNIPGDIVFKLPFGLQWVWPIPLFILVTLAPESPWWLVRHGHIDRAKNVINRLAARGAVDSDNTVAMMKRTIDIEAESRAGSSYLGCFRGANLRRTEIACVAWAVTIWSGSSFANHPSYFFVQAGMTPQQAISMDLGIRGVAFVATGLAWVNLSYMGRRTMFVGGMFALFVTLILAGILGTLTVRGYPSAMWGEAAMCVIWVLIWDSMVTTCAYAIVGESSSTRLRAKTTGLARILYNCSGIVGGTLNTYFMNPAAWNIKGMSAWFWAGTCGLAFVWAYFRLPEMKGRSFRELDILFERGVPARQFAKTEVDDKADE